MEDDLQGTSRNRKHRALDHRVVCEWKVVFLGEVDQESTSRNARGRVGLPASLYILCIRRCKRSHRTVWQMALSNVEAERSRGRKE